MSLNQLTLKLASVEHTYPDWERLRMPHELRERTSPLVAKRVNRYHDTVARRMKESCVSALLIAAVPVRGCTLLLTRDVRLASASSASGGLPPIADPGEVRCRARCRDHAKFVWGRGA